MPNKEWDDGEVSEIKIMKKTMKIHEIAKRKGLRVYQVNYALYSYCKKGKIKSMAGVRKRFDDREKAPEQPKKKTFWGWLFG